MKIAFASLSRLKLGTNERGFRKRLSALPLLGQSIYLLAITTAMVGWLWFLGWLSWDFIVWATSEIP